MPRISQKDNKAYKCTLCVDRVSVGQEPACVKTCPTGAINFGSKADMLVQAEGRVSELQGRGFAGAGIYDPQAVGGTHVFYVLQHADKPQLYHKLNPDPRISSAIQGWKGWLKPVAAMAFFATLAGTVFHYIGVGPNEVEEDPKETQV
ncbi:Formate dehydrogenase, nitrate-inducible, iron-sulfur subunit [compost metagenome]